MLFDSIKHSATQHSLLTANQTIVIGLSGGPDSIFLLHFLKHMQPEYNLTLIAAHLNHQWRPEADTEEQLCKNIAEQLDVTFVSTTLSAITHTVKHNGSKEEYARNMRRFFLEKTAHAHDANAIALGHHAQDQQETFFIRLIRGTSLTGLTSMKPRHGLYVRFLLETNKSDMLTWLHDNGITYATDESNNSTEFLRNRIRLHILPELQACDKRFNSNFIATLSRLQQDDDLINHITQQTFESICSYDNDKHIIDVPSLLSSPSALHVRLIIHWLIVEKVRFPVTQAFFDEIIRFLQSPRGGNHQLNAQWSIIKKRNKAHIAHNNPQQ